MVHIIGQLGTITERKLQDQNPGTQLASSVKVVGSSVKGNVRTVVVSRSVLSHLTLTFVSRPLYTFVVQAYLAMLASVRTVLCWHPSALWRVGVRPHCVVLASSFVIVSPSVLTV
jgi:hypothetical protein